MLDFTNLSPRQVRSWINFVSLIISLSPITLFSFQLYFILVAVTWILVILAGIVQAQRSYKELD